MSVPPPTGGNPWQSQPPPAGGGQPPYPPPPPMQPPVPPPPPARRSGVPGWVWAVVGCGGCGFVGIPLLAAILFPVFAQAREKARQTSCQSNLKQQGLALLMYAQDYNDRLPPAAAWMDLTDPYVGGSTTVVRQCPSVSRGGGSSSVVYGYAFDSRLGGKPQSRIATSRTVTMGYDSDDLTRNANDPGTSLPGGRGRHARGNNLLYADGSVRWVPLGRGGGAGTGAASP